MNRSQLNPGASLCAIILEDGRDCNGTVSPDTPLNLCRDHFLEAYEWIAPDKQPRLMVSEQPCELCGLKLARDYPGGLICDSCGWKIGDIPSIPVPQSTVSVVYYIKFGDRIKIGTSQAPKTRLGSLPYDELLAFERGARDVEQKRHLQFAEHRVGRTEWFTLNEQLDKHIRVLRAGVDDPWAQYEFWTARERA